MEMCYSCRVLSRWDIKGVELLVKDKGEKNLKCKLKEFFIVVW